MNPERKEILTLTCLPGRLTPAETAWRLGFEPDHIPVLVGLGLLKPLGHPSPSTVKYFASVEVETLRTDPRWLAKATDALRMKWKQKNDIAKRRVNLRPQRVEVLSQTSEPPALKSVRSPIV